MRKNIAFLIFITLLSCVNKTDTILSGMQRDASTLLYNVNFKKKPFFKNDTFIKKYNVYLEKSIIDSVYGYNFKISDSIQTIYNFNNTLYIINHSNRSYKKRREINNQLNQLIFPNCNLKKDDLFGNNTIIDTLEDRVFVLKKYEDENEFKNIKEKYSFSLVNNELINITSEIDFQNTSQFISNEYEKLNLNVSIDIETELKQLLENYTNQKYLEKKESKSHLKLFSDIRGVVLENNKQKELVEYNSKVIILDYWFMACYPCIKTIPMLNRINEKYSSNEVQVIGVNLIDRNVEKLKNFVNYNKIKYPIFLTNESPLLVKEYPTLIILDEKYNIISTLYGYDENKEKEIFNLIEKIIQE
ncbi:TlpA family protein disulfide reductase [Corallibacter sp.]|uniref:TlpA family protein disulfide reductase n=1 Tax=Corallibacter sp. TaxID=2038084 RepID=UPI003AB33297